jgi:phage gp36-like protein
MGDIITYDADIKPLLSRSLLEYLTDVSNNTPNQDIIDKTIASAEGKAKSRLGVRFDLVLSSTLHTNNLKAILVDIVTYRLYVRSGQEVPEGVKDVYDEAIADLKEMASGEQVLGADTDDEADLVTGGGVITFGRG